MAQLYLIWIQYGQTLIKHVSSKRYKLASAPIEDSDLTAHERSLIWVFNWLSMGSQGSNVSLGGKLRFWSDCVDAQTDLNLCCTQMPTGT